MRDPTTESTFHVKAYDIDFTLMLIVLPRFVNSQPAAFDNMAVGDLLAFTDIQALIPGGRILQYVLTT